MRLNAAFRSNLQWWAEFSQEWNGISRMTQDPHISPQPIIISDASGNWGCGAFNLDLDWFQLQYVVQFMEHTSYHSEGAGTNSDRMCRMGKAMARKVNSLRP